MRTDAGDPVFFLDDVVEDLEPAAFEQRYSVNGEIAEILEKIDEVDRAHGPHADRPGLHIPRGNVDNLDDPPRSLARRSRARFRYITDQLARAGESRVGLTSRRA